MQQSLKTLMPVDEYDELVSSINYLNQDTELGIVIISKEKEPVGGFVEVELLLPNPFALYTLGKMVQLNRISSSIKTAQNGRK